jgi:hypothetical protein
VSAKVDGKDYPGKGSPDADTCAFKRIDQNAKGEPVNNTIYWDKQ